jgi:GntR family transcriptional regulator
LKIVILNTAGIPIYEQIKEQIKAAIYAGELAENEALPSIRQLARDLKISVITTTRAYNDLEQEGFIANMQGKGCFVCPKNEELIREKALREIENGFVAAIFAAKVTRIQKKELLDMFDIIAREENYE